MEGEYIMKKIIFVVFVIGLLAWACDDGAKVFAKPIPEPIKPEASETKTPTETQTEAAKTFFPLVDGATWVYDVDYQGEVVGEAKITMTKSDDNTFVRSSEASFNAQNVTSSELGSPLIGAAKFDDTFIKEGNQIKLMFSSVNFEASSPNSSGTLVMTIKYNEPVVVLNNDPNLNVGDTFDSKTTIEYHSAIQIGDGEKKVIEKKDLPVTVKYGITDTLQEEKYTTFVQEFMVDTSENVSLSYGTVWLSKGVGPTKMKGGLSWFTPFGIKHKDITLILKEVKIP